MNSILLLCLILTPAHAESAHWAETEKLAVRLQKEVLLPWKKSWKARDSRAFDQVLAPSVSWAGWEDAQKLRRDLDGIQEFDWSAPKFREISRADADKQVADYLGRFSKIDDVDLTLWDIDPNAEPSGAATLRVSFDLRGKPKSGGLRTDRGEIKIVVVPSDNGWKIARVERGSFETLTAKKPVFVDATHEAGLDNAIPLFARQEAIRRGGYALAVGDFDGDGRPDIYFGGRGPGRLLRNQGDGTFKDVTKSLGLAEDTLVKSASFVDMDNDGKVDLVLQRFVDDSSQELVFYRNSGKKFERMNAVVQRKRKHDRPMSMTIADFDGDGRPDLFVGYPGVRDFTDGGISTDKDISHGALYLNKGGWRFEETLDPAINLAEPIRPHSLVSADLDQDGRPDLLVVDDRRASRFFLNGDSGKFSEDRGASPGNEGWAMTAPVGDFANFGRLGLYYTNIDFSAGHRILNLIRRDGEAAQKEQPGFARLDSLLHGNRLFRPGPKESHSSMFTDVTETAGVGWAGEAPGGAAFIDYNNSGWLSIYVTNGLWSADPDNEYSSEFIQKLLAEDEAGSAADQKPHDPNQVMKMLQQTGYSFGGYQRHRLFRNNGDGTFTEVGYVTGADRTEDGYVVAVLDYNRDGRADLILRNADPASLKYPYSPVTLLKNVSDTKNRSLAVELRTADGGAAPIGARLAIKVGGRSQTRQLLAVEGASQDEMVTLFGLGDKEKADSLEVRWASGVTDRFQNVPAGRIVIKEGVGELTSVWP